MIAPHTTDRSIGMALLFLRPYGQQHAAVTALETDRSRLRRRPRPSALTTPRAAVMRMTPPI
ncbi:hypothetical protein DBR42_15340 [Pelomonas sp. HMWF004]|nr:hypothetical protein DBR42_15340 [Pelomonas sp. HMWF004]